MRRQPSVLPTVARNDAYRTSEDAVVVGGLPGGGVPGVLANDRGAAPLSVDRLHRLPGAIGEEVALPSGALLTLHADGAFVYDPRDAFDGLEAGERAIDTVLYRAFDGFAKTDWARVVIHLTGAPDQPDPPGPAPAPQTLRLEAENFAHPGGFVVERLGAIASGGAALRLALEEEGGRPAETASAATVFSGVEGRYALALRAFDEGDGATTLSLAVNGRTLDTWTLDSSHDGPRGGGWTPDGGNAVTLGVSGGVALRTGDVLSVTATRNGEEFARLDYLDIVPAAAETATATPPALPVSGGSGGGGGSGGNERIMPLGDSITDGDGNGGYRAPLFRQLEGAGYAVDFVGTLARGGPGIDPDNEGHSGWTIGMIADSLPHWLDLNPPETVLLMAGTNDILGGRPAAAAAGDLAALIDRLFDEAPDVDLFVAGILPIDPARWDGATARTAAEAEAYNALLPDVVARARAEGHSVVFVPMDGIGTGDLVDGVHPGQDGFATIAGNYYDAMVAAGVLGDVVAP